MQHLINVEVLVKTARFQFAGIQQAVEVRVYEWQEAGEGARYRVSSSHDFQSPNMRHPEVPSSSINYASSAQDALDRSLSDFNDWYAEALQAGEQPLETWLKPNQYFA